MNINHYAVISSYLTAFGYSNIFLALATHSSPKIVDYDEGLLYVMGGEEPSFLSTYRKACEWVIREICKKKTVCQ